MVAWGNTTPQHTHTHTPQHTHTHTPTHTHNPYNNFSNQSGWYSGPPVPPPHTHTHTHIQEDVYGLSRFSMQQYDKLDKNSVDSLSKYNPLEIFSNTHTCIQDQIDNLINTPQNNMRVCINGEFIPPINLSIVLPHMITSALQCVAPLKEKIRSLHCLAEGHQNIAYEIFLKIENIIGDEFIQTLGKGEVYLEALRDLVGWVEGDCLSECFMRYAQQDNQVDVPKDLLPTQEKHLKKGKDLLGRLKDGHVDDQLIDMCVKWMCCYIIGRTFADLSLMFLFFYH
eukprot:GHVR01114287.1.p1 GENE.GHVR01114287.1~~GHVR01114287.1.p1  ORF type:complete len:283 (+),score=111.25 GHVR01114287.1:24-872(+)